MGSPMTGGVADVGAGGKADAGAVATGGLAAADPSGAVSATAAWAMAKLNDPQKPRVNAAFRQ